MALYKGIPKPEDDGITHINVYSKGSTSLGRKLSNFALIPFEHPKYGSFDTIEGLWHWLSTGKQFAFFRRLTGYQAKTTAASLAKITCPTFEEDIRVAIQQKIACNEALRRELMSCDLPLTHYYNYGGKVIVVDKHNWVLTEIDRIRTALRSQDPSIPFVDIGTKPY